MTANQRLGVAVCSLVVSLIATFVVDMTAGLVCTAIAGAIVSIVSFISYVDY